MIRHFLLLMCCLIVLSACGGSPNASVSVIRMPGASLSAVSISFGNQSIGTTVDGPAITLSNNGTAALRIGVISVGDPFFQTNDCGASVAVGGTCTIHVSFAPSNIGEYSSGVSITDNATGSPQTVMLSGTGVTEPPPRCTPIGSICGPGQPICCPAPFPHHSICSNRTGFGTCVIT